MMSNHAPHGRWLLAAAALAALVDAALVIAAARFAGALS